MSINTKYGNLEKEKTAIKNLGKLKKEKQMIRVEKTRQILHIIESLYESWMFFYVIFVGQLEHDCLYWYLCFLQGWCLQVILPSHSPTVSSKSVPCSQKLVSPSSISCSYANWLKKDVSVFFFQVLTFVAVFSSSLWTPWVKCCELGFRSVTQNITFCWCVFQFSVCFVFFS